MTRADLANKCSITELLNVFIKRSLEAHNLDPEKHIFDGTFTEKIEKKRRTNRGLQNKVINESNIDESDSDSSVEEKNDMIKQLERDLEVGKELQIYSAKLRQTLSIERIKEIFESNLEIFENIRAGVQDSWRHKMYHDLRNKTANISFLRSRMISVPFSDQQQEVIYSHVKSRWLFSRGLYMTDYEYIDYVLLPEVFIKIYQIHFSLESPRVAEERIFNALGSLSPEVLDVKSIFII